MRAVRAEVTLLPTLEHPRWPNRARYMPRIVMGDPSQREAHVVAGNQLTESYLGVWVKDAPDEWRPGQTAEITPALMYWPDEQYLDVVPQATFTLREGPKIVGFGYVSSTSESSRP